MPEPSTGLCSHCPEYVNSGEASQEQCHPYRVCARTWFRCRADRSSLEEPSLMACVVAAAVLCCDRCSRTWRTGRCLRQADRNGTQDAATRSALVCDVVSDCIPWRVYERAQPAVVVLVWCWFHLARRIRHIALQAPWADGAEPRRDVDRLRRLPAAGRRRHLPGSHRSWGGAQCLARRRPRGRAHRLLGRGDIHGTS